MHTPLAGHLHTEECNKIIEEMLKCYEEHNKVQQIFGACDNLYTRMRDWFNAFKMLKWVIKRKYPLIFTFASTCIECASNLPHQKVHQGGEAGQGGRGEEEKL